METTALLAWVAVAFQFIAAGAMMMWPDQKWIAVILMLFGLGLAIISGWFFLSANYPKRFEELKRVWFLIPIGIAGGLIIAWFAFKLYPESKMHDYRTWPSNVNETISRKTYRNESVEIDGKTFDHCHFSNVTFVYHGTAGSTFLESEFLGKNYIKTDNQAAVGLQKFIMFLKNRPGVKAIEIGELDSTGKVNVWERLEVSDDELKSGKSESPKKSGKSPKN
jgi:hypothetical protein